MGFDWQVSPKLRIYGEAPTEFTIRHNLKSNLNMGINLLGNNTSYTMNKQNWYLKNNYAHTGVFIERYLLSNWVMRGTVACAITRQIEVYDKRDKTNGVLDFITLGPKPKSLNEPLENGMVLRLSLSYRVAVSE